MLPSEGQITEAVQSVSESVVTIESTMLVRDRRFGSMPVKGAGSGVILSSAGFIITNYHVVEGLPKVEVGLKSGETIKGTVLGRDPQTDIAVVKVKDGGLHASSLGDSESLKVGQIALAIGNTLGLPGGHTVSAGVISALRRPLPWADFVFEGLIQTDAAINPGNSGGALADLDGNVIGINTAMIPFAQGVGFAIPINTVKSVSAQILENGRVIRPWLGISGTNLDEAMARRFGLSETTRGGVLLVRVSPDSPADEAGLAAGDVIVGINGLQVEEMKDLLQALSKQHVGQVATLDVARRYGRSFTVTLRLTATPKDLLLRN
ncbi:MAG TPA: trypsin-like peptidase domain-containing protein [Nitrososphaerales archaeon]|nr:trypsin-like peptidase domain-containing protein [Nitrososphaerales archaeon]